MEKAFDIDGGTAIAVGNYEGLVGRRAEYVFLVKPMSQAGHECDVGRRCRAQIENF